MELVEANQIIMYDAEILLVSQANYPLEGYRQTCFVSQ
ncbi:hypothetical protein NIES4071_14270 [Calothrix sp. NIES-4071]|nr:hypothetical protein NIES4071_14270 [Calothrix sp. NIES-4071]BAZ55765.1 hypothetical protein NIES4105_14220 [Calothrix sp. NIES-4105]